MAQASRYEPVWQQLKIDGIVKVRIVFKEDASAMEKDALFHRVRKGVSKRKDQDYDFRNANPSAKIHVQSKLYETGEITLELRYLASTLTLSDLASL